MRRLSLLLLLFFLLACAPPNGDAGSSVPRAPESLGVEPTGAMERIPALDVHRLSPPRTNERPLAVERLLRDAQIPGFGSVDVGIVGTDIVAVEAAGTGAWKADEVHVLTGHWIVPAFIDSHVHLSYLNQPEELASGGVAAVVDHAAPLGFFDAAFAPLTVRGSGPMITAVAGYPTQSWGANGYGLECSDGVAAVEAVNELADLGASLIKVPLGHGPTFSHDALKSIVEAAHARSLPVSVHALSEHEVLLAAEAGADVLAHAPAGPIGAAAAAGWKGRAVITTFAAFGAGEAAMENVGKLHAAGATVLYGTDFGNSTWAGVHPIELAGMAQAGMSPAEILAAGTHVPADFWGFKRHGRIAPGHAASLLVLEGDPLEDTSLPAAPIAVFNEGTLRSGSLD